MVFHWGFWRSSVFEDLNFKAGNNIFCKILIEENVDAPIFLVSQFRVCWFYKINYHMIRFLYIPFMMNHDEVNHIENLKSTRVFQQYGSPTRPLELRYFHVKALN